MIVCDTGEKAYNYKQYLNTQHWKDFREKAKAHYKCCQACKTTHYLQVHHVKYDRLGHEKFSDVTLLCMYCHDELHFKRMKRAETILDATKRFVEWDKVNSVGIKKPTKKEKSITCPKCKLAIHKNLYRWVAFKNGMTNIQINCSKCGKFLGYAPQKNPFIEYAKQQKLAKQH